MGGSCYGETFSFIVAVAAAGLVALCMTVAVFGAYVLGWRQWTPSGGFGREE